MARPAKCDVEVVKALDTASAPLTVPELAARTGYSQVQVRRALWRMGERGTRKVCFGDPKRRDRSGHGHYQYVLCAPSPRLFDVPALAAS